VGNQSVGAWKLNLNDFDARLNREWSRLLRVTGIEQFCQAVRKASTATSVCASS
jgi:hypothetical protein